jgi:hypothetical protein
MNVANILSTLAVMGLATLRQNIVLARLANRQYERALTGSMTKGATINIVVPAAIVAVDVTAAAVPPSTAAVTPTTVPITLDTWKEAPFTLADFDIARLSEGVAGIVPMQAAEAIKALVNAIEDYLWTKSNFYGFSGTPGVTPFAAGPDTYLDARKIANIQLMPMEPRFAVLDPAAEANALGLRAFQDAAYRGDPAGIIKGQIGEKLGALWLMTQRVPTQSAGTGTGYVINGANGLGLTTIAVKTGTGTIPNGAVITIAGDSQTYSVQSSVGGGTVTSLTILPGLQLAHVDNDAITIKPAFVKNLLVHRDALGFAMAPLEETVVAPNLVAIQTIIDPESGLSLRVELTREHKRWRWSYDAMWGGSLVRGDLGIIMAG